MARYVDLLTDFTFKKIFGSEPNKELLTSLLQAVFRGQKHFMEVVYDKNEYVGDSKDMGTVIFDLTCTAKDGSKYIIEVQRSNQYNLKKRMLYYSSRLIADQAPKEDRKKWNFRIPQICVVAIIDGFVISDSKSGYVHDVCLCNKDSGVVFYSGLEFVYLELDLFLKRPEDLDGDLDRWLYVLKHLSKLNHLPDFLNHTVFERVFDLAEFTNLTKEEQFMYNTEVKRRRDQENTTYYQINEAKKKARKEARKEVKEARKEAKEEGLVARREGRAQGKLEGQLEAKTEIVRNLLSKYDFTDVQICDMAEVTLDFVKEVRASLGKE